MSEKPDSDYGLVLSPEEQVIAQCGDVKLELSYLFESQLGPNRYREMWPTERCLGILRLTSFRLIASSGPRNLDQEVRHSSSSSILGYSEIPFRFYPPEPKTWLNRVGRWDSYQAAVVLPAGLSLSIWCPHSSKGFSGPEDRALKAHVQKTRQLSLLLARALTLLGPPSSDNVSLLAAVKQNRIEQERRRRD